MLLDRRIESAPANIEHDCAACYASAIEAALASALREVGPTLKPPRADPDRARRVLGHFIETVTGFALGAIANHLMSGLRRWYGDDGIASMRAAMHGWPAHERSQVRLATIESEGSAAEQLHVRFCHVAKQARALIDAVPQRPMTAVMLSLLAKEDDVERRIAHELALGWRVYTAAVTHKRYPQMSRLWQQWQQQLDGKPVLTRDETEQAGYILLVR